jgi:hypothetical protein
MHRSKADHLGDFHMHTPAASECYARAGLSATSLVGCFLRAVNMKSPSPQFTPAEPTQLVSGSVEFLVQTVLKLTSLLGALH